MNDNKSSDINKNFTEAQVKNKQKILEGLQNDVKEWENKILFLKSKFESDNRTLLSELNLREAELKKKESEIDKRVSDAKRDNSFLQEQLGKVNHKMQELTSKEQSLAVKVDKLKKLAAELG